MVVKSEKFENRLDLAFKSQKEEKNGAFIPFLTIGDPNPEIFLRIVQHIAPYSDVLELGIPFSDPLADGPTIQKANLRALKAGTALRNSFELIKKVREITDKPIVLLTYANILGVDENLEVIAEKFGEIGVDGIVLADVPVEELAPFKIVLNKYRIHTVLLASPATNRKRMERILRETSGFLYLVSVKGTTGARNRISREGIDALRNIIDLMQDPNRKKPNGYVPVCLGFGISTPEHVRRAIVEGADGVIVGSAIIKRIEEFAEKNPDIVKDRSEGVSNASVDEDEFLEDLERYVKSLKEATLSGGGLS